MLSSLFFPVFDLEEVNQTHMIATLLYQDSNLFVAWMEVLAHLKPKGAGLSEKPLHSHIVHTIW